MVRIVITGIIIGIGITATARWSSVTFYFGSIVIRFDFSIRSGTMVSVGMVVRMRERRRISHSICVGVVVTMMRRHKRRVRM